MKTNCLFCGNQVTLVFVHGHYQCPICNSNALPCCDGDNCNNIFLAGDGHNNKEKPAVKEEKQDRE